MIKSFYIYLFILFLYSPYLISQDLPYGNNGDAGRYVSAKDAKIYYEVYGEGQPIVLLHGGFGYIDSFKKYIPVLSRDYKVIAIASRGYGKSGIGTSDYTYDLLADDIACVIRKECTEKTVLIGHSDGAMICYIVAFKYPGIIKKVIAIGGPLGTVGYEKEGLNWLQNYSVQELFQYRPDLKQLMPQPERSEELGKKLGAMWSTAEIMQVEDLNEITASVLLLFGDRDLYCSIEHIVQIYKNLPNAQLAVFPGASHVDVSFRNTFLLENIILPYIQGES